MLKIVNPSFEVVDRTDGFPVIRRFKLAPSIAFPSASTTFTVNVSSASASTRAGG